MTFAKLVRFAERKLQDDSDKASSASLAKEIVGTAIDFARWRAGSTDEQPTDPAIRIIVNGFRKAEPNRSVAWSNIEELALLTLYAYVNRTAKRASMLFSRDKRRTFNAALEKLKSLKDNLI